jgi:hypothetical protein
MIKDEHNAFCKPFYSMWIAKLLRTFISVKLWTIVAITSISTWLLVNDFITGTHWTTVVISGIVAIVLARSVFQISSLKNGHSNGENKK